jgi:putative chitinase
MMTVQQFARCTGASMTRASSRYGAYMDAMPRFDITTLQRQAMFLANVGHESGGFQWPTELWGPTPQQKRYERDFTAPWPRTAAEARQPGYAINRLAYGLGNLQKGDGRRFCGHGDIQTTGRGNHAAAGQRMAAKFPAFAVPDFEAHPEQLADPQWAALSACDFVATHGCNAQADAGRFDGYCDLINLGHLTVAEGDSNGYTDRVIRLHAAYAALGLQ